MKKRKRFYLPLALAVLCILTSGALPRGGGVRAQTGEMNEAKLVRSLYFEGEDAFAPAGGYQHVAGVGGGSAVRLQNAGGAMATQYIDLGAFDMAEKSVSVAFWVRVSAAQIEQNNHCSLISNKNWDSQRNPGFMVATSYTDGTFKGGWLDFSAQSNTKACFQKNLPNFDGSWHSVIVTFDRDGDAVYYADGREAARLDISFLAGKSATGGNLFVGCDSNKKYGVLDASFDSVEVYEGVMTADQIARHALPPLLDAELAKAEGVYAAELAAGRMTEAKKQAYTAMLERVEAARRTADYPSYENLIGEVRSAAGQLLETGEQPLVTFNAVSDIHIDGAAATPGNDVAYYEKKMETAFTGLGKMFPDTDAVLIPGDFTRNGKTQDFDKFYAYLEEYNTAENVMMSIGNHEVKSLSDFADIKRLFVDGVNRFGGDTDEVYFDTWINGYHFISLSTESNADKSGAYLSDAQLSWFESALAEKARANQPIFVILHQPLADTFPLSTKYSVGPQDAQLKRILTGYPQTVLITGHLHNGYVDDRSFIRSPYGYLIDMPAVKQNDLANQSGNLVYRFETFADRTVVRVIDYERQIELYEYRKVIDHNELAPDYEDGDVSGITAANSAGEALTEVIDGNEKTGRTVDSLNRSDHEIILDLGEAKSVAGLRYCAAEVENAVTMFDCEYSYDGKTWLGFGGSAGVFAGGAGYRMATFTPFCARYIKFMPLSSASHTDERFVTSVAELAVLYVRSEVASALQPPTLAADAGTAFADLTLPETVTAVLDNGRSKRLHVVWERGEYNGDRAGVYVIYGRLVTDRYTANSRFVAAMIRVRVR